jgi:hypothetical protein
VYPAARLPRKSNTFWAGGVEIDLALALHRHARYKLVFKEDDGSAFPLNRRWRSETNQPNELK